MIITFIHPSPQGRIFFPPPKGGHSAAGRVFHACHLVPLAAYTGACHGGLLDLRWHDIDLDGKRLTIKGFVGVVEGQRVEVTTKSSRTRVVSVDDATATVRREHQKAQEAEKAASATSWKGIDDTVFTTAWGGSIYPTTVTGLPRKLIEAHNKTATNPLIHLHDLRHVHATLLLLAGVSRTRRRSPPRPRRPRDHPARLRPRDPLGRDCCG